MQRKEDLSGSDIKDALKATFPVFAGYLFLGLGFGIMMQAKGFSVLLTVLMSLFIYAGSMQYLSVELLASTASLPIIAITTFLVNVRHLFYGISIVDKYKNAGIKKLYLMFALTDETYSLVCTSKFDAYPNAQNMYFAVSLFDHAYWVLGSALGAISGAFIPFDTTGIDFALTALFVSVFTDQWLSCKDHFPALTGVLASVICLLIFKADNFLIPAMILIAAVLLIKPKIKKEAIA